MTNEKKNLLLSRLKSNLILFGKAIFPRAFSLPSPAVHYEIAEALTGPDKFLNIIAPRGIAKSTLVGIVYVLWHLMFTEGTKVVVIVSRTQAHAVNLLQSIKDVLEYSTPFRALFGYWGINTSKSWTSTQIVLKDGSAIVCRGMGQMIRGLNINGQRPSLLILDDPEDENNTKTPEAMDANLRWLMQGAEPSLDAKKGKLVIIGTPLNQSCLVWTLRESSKYKTLHYGYILLNEDGTERSLWPEMYTLEQLYQMRREAEELGKLSAFYKERLCQIIGDEDQIFKKDYLRYWDGYLKLEKNYHFLHITHIDDLKLAEEKVIPVTVFMGVDPASSLNTNADYFTIMPIAIDKELNRYVLPYFRRRTTPMQGANEIIKMYKELKPNLTQIETVGFQEMLRDYIRSTGIAIPGIEIDNKPRNSKSSRLESLQPVFARKKVYLKRSMKDFEDELLIYPRGKHEDTLDGFYYANKNVYPPSHELPSATNKKKKKSFLNWKVC